MASLPVVVDEELGARGAGRGHAFANFLAQSGMVRVLDAQLHGAHAGIEHPAHPGRAVDDGVKAQRRVRQRRERRNAILARNAEDGQVPGMQRETAARPHRARARAGGLAVAKRLRGGHLRQHQRLRSRRSRWPGPLLRWRRRRSPCRGCGASQRAAGSASRWRAACSRSRSLQSPSASPPVMATRLAAHFAQGLRGLLHAGAIQRRGNAQQCGGFGAIGSRHGGARQQLGAIGLQQFLVGKRSAGARAQDRVDHQRQRGVLPGAGGRSSATSTRRLAALPSRPVLMAAGGMSSASAASCASSNAGDTASMCRTATEFCAVTAATALQPWTPKASKARRSACKPAPPPLSEPATVQTMGGLLIGRRAFL